MAKKRNQRKKAAPKAQPKRQAPKAKAKKQAPKPQNIKKAIAQVSAAGISGKELKQIAKQTKATPQQIIKRMDSMASKGRDVRLNAGAANLLIRKAQKAPAYSAPNFGTGKIGSFLQSRIGTPSTPGAMIQGRRIGGTAGTPGLGRIPGGMQVTRRGTLAVRKPTLGVTGGRGAGPYDGMEIRPFDPNGPGPLAPRDKSPDTGLDDTSSDFEDLLGPNDFLGDDFLGDDFLGDDFLGGGDFTPMPTTEDVTDTTDPLQLASLGQSYIGDAIRAKQRQRKGRRDYRRGGSISEMGATNRERLTVGGFTL